MKNTTKTIAERNYNKWIWYDRKFETLVLYTKYKDKYSKLQISRIGKPDLSENFLSEFVKEGTFLKPYPSSNKTIFVIFTLSILYVFCAEEACELSHAWVDKRILSTYLFGRSSSFKFSQKQQMYLMRGVLFFLSVYNINYK